LKPFPRLTRLGFSLLLVLAFLLPAAGLAQDQQGAMAGRKHWWDLDRAGRCGRMWCSRVVTPHIPLGPRQPRVTLAVMPTPEERPQDSAARVEARSSAVANTLQRLSRELARRLDDEPLSRQERSLGFWLNRRPKPRHPLTPSLEVGVKNRTPVIFLPADAETKGPQVTLITLTEPDSLANGLDRESLANEWDAVLEDTLSRALWGSSFNRAYPWVRGAGALLVLGLGVLGVGLCNAGLEGLYEQRRQRRLNLRARQGQLKPDNPDTGLTLQEDQRLERRLRRTRLLVKLLQVLRIAVVVMVLTITLYLFPATRLFAALLLQLSFSLPVIWISVVVLDSLLVWAVMRRLNRWAVDAQAADPGSLRPRMRLDTNARVLKGTIAAGTTVLGIYLTVLLFGLDPQILAGAGILAVALGFLARGLVEDLIGGVRILAADRFAIGDSIAVNGHMGLVEAMNLVQTQLRGGEGEVVTIPNGMIRDCINRSKDWSRVNFEIDIAWGSDLNKALSLLERVAGQLAEDRDWQDQILEPPLLLGVDRLDQSGLRLKLWIKTQPLKQWGVARELRRRVKPAFDAAGIEPGIPQQVLRGGESCSEQGT
jgi:small conductance mechanosensitive channel